MSCNVAKKKTQQKAESRTRFRVPGPSSLFHSVSEETTRGKNTYFWKNLYQNPLSAVLFFPKVEVISSNREVTLAAPSLTDKQLAVELQAGVAFRRGLAGLPG